MGMSLGLTPAHGLALGPEPEQVCDLEPSQTCAHPTAVGEGRAPLWFRLCGYHSATVSGPSFSTTFLLAQGLGCGEEGRCCILRGSVFFFLLSVEEAHLSCSE